MREKSVMPGSRLHGWVVTKPLTYWHIWHYLATRTLQIIRFDDCCFSMRIGDMIILNGVFCLKRLTCKAGFVRICEVTCSIEDQQHEHHDLVRHIHIRFQPNIGIRKPLPGRDREGQWITVELQGVFGKMGT